METHRSRLRRKHLHLLAISGEVDGVQCLIDVITFRDDQKARLIHTIFPQLNFAEWPSFVIILWLAPMVA